MSDNATLLATLPEELRERLLDAHGCSGELWPQLSAEFSDVSATCHLDTRRVRKWWSDQTKDVCRKWFAELNLDKRGASGALTNAARQKRYRRDRSSVYRPG